MNKVSNKTKKTIDIVVNVILWIFVAFAVAVTVFAFATSSNAKNVPVIGGKCYLSVMSDSMKSDKAESFKKGDLIIGEYIYNKADAIDSLKVGDIITFEIDLNGDGEISKGEYDTHRITAIDRDDNGMPLAFYTKGDNPEFANQDPSFLGDRVRRVNVIAKYNGSKVGGVGGFLSFIGSKLGFGLCIILPLVIFFGYEVYVFVKTVLSVKNEGKKVITAADEELIKQRAIEEYLRSQNQANDEQSQSEDK